MSERPRASISLSRPPSHPPSRSLFIPPFLDQPFVSSVSPLTNFRPGVRFYSSFWSPSPPPFSRQPFSLLRRTPARAIHHPPDTPVIRYPLDLPTTISCLSLSLSRSLFLLFFTSLSFISSRFPRDLFGSSLARPPSAIYLQVQFLDKALVNTLQPPLVQIKLNSRDSPRINSSCETTTTTNHEKDKLEKSTSQLLHHLRASATARQGFPTIFIATRASFHPRR